ncbi:SigE family RNA polymerase sigma factor [Actinoplanes sp. RD1]|uniref:SigE family RNA polymerase sigma factor n=1 Tax=Actinoplanes sp. RD1 TaxID=3064538 RepID=UPI0027422FC7|nr:SigE family RNA polymerase sigma factor [Actinoplanes sp. RD1]
MRGVRDQQFHDFVLARRTDLVRTATLLTAGDAHLAEDLVQQTLTKLYVAWPQFQRAANHDAYVRRTLVNALIDERRRLWWRRERPMAELPDRAALQPAGDQPADAVRAALRELPPKMRAALVFRYFHDLDVAETAEALGCSQGTVKSQTARALEKLRAVLPAQIMLGAIR